MERVSGKQSNSTRNAAMRADIQRIPAILLHRPDKNQLQRRATDTVLSR